MRALLGISALAVMAACTPAKPTMDVEQAQAYCRGKVSKPVDTSVHLGVGVGSGGKVHSNSGVHIGVNVDSLLTPDATYEQCVQRNAGVAPTEPYR
jgi:hypothetical protein